MILVLAILCVLTAPTLGTSTMLPGWKRTFSIDYLAIDSTSFVEMPQNTTQAAAENWINVTRPTGPTGYENLTLWCPSTNYTICILFDDTGYVAGAQVAFDPAKISDTIFDWERAGFTNWTTTCDGTSITYYASQLYLISEDDLQTSAESRIAARDANYIVQGDYYYVTSFNKTLIKVPVNETEMESCGYTKQACMIGMGQHYFYNMSSTLTCSVDTISTWFHTTYYGRSIVAGLVIPGVYTAGNGVSPFEAPSKTAIELIVPNGPDCLYEYGDTPGIITIHFYFVKRPYFITCLW